MGLEVDGGVSPATIERCHAAGANLMVAGSAIYDQPSPGEAWQKLAATRRGRVNERDAELLDRALDLAERGRRSASPNPLVGCVIARDGRVLGEGWHERRGEPHAERNALDACTRAGRGRHGLRHARALQPPRPPAALCRCAHRGGRRARRVRDRRPEPGGRRARSRAPARRRRRGRARGRPPRGAARAGRTPPSAPTSCAAARSCCSSSPPRWTAASPRARGRAAGSPRPRAARLVHDWRAEFDAVAVGSGTALADDPELLPRDARAAGRSACRCASSSTAAAVWRRAAGWRRPPRPHPSRASRRTARRRRRRASRAWRPPRWRRRSAPLGAREVTSLLVEGGAELAAGFLRAGVVDALALFLAPRLIGGDGRPLLGPLGVSALAEAPALLETSRARGRPRRARRGPAAPLP